MLTPEGSKPLEYRDEDALQIELEFFLELAESGGGIDATAYHAQRSLEVAYQAKQAAAG